MTQFMSRACVFASVAVGAAVLAACLPEPTPFRCETDAQCGDGLRCIVDVAACREARGPWAGGRQCVPARGPRGPGLAPPADPAPPFPRDVCLVGPAMPTARDACVDLVCAADATCCTLGWSEQCVQRAGRTCGVATAPTESRCPSDVTLIGRAPLVSTLRFRPDPTVLHAVHCLAEMTGGGDNGFSVSSAWADADGDGDVDLATVSLGGLRIFDGQGVNATNQLDLGAPVVEIRDATPHPDTTYQWGSRVVWGDADHDGDLDLLWIDEVHGLRVFRHDPGAPPTYTPTWLFRAADLGTGRHKYGAGWMQLDTDADLEIVATQGAQLVIFDRQNDGNWQRIEGPAVDDGGFVATFDRLVMSTGPTFRAGTPSLVAGPTLGINTNRGLVLADLDGDGLLDVVVGQMDALRWAPGLAGGYDQLRTIPTEYPDAWGIAVGDFDGDRKLDVISGSYTRRPTLLLQRQPQTFNATLLPAVVEAVDAQAVTLTGVDWASAGICWSPP